MPDDFFFKWNDFQQHISSSVLRLGQDSKFSDVTLACDDDHQVPVHKIILAASSQVFSELLKQCNHLNPIIFMRGTKPNLLNSILDFIYYGEVRIKHDDINSFIKIAEQLAIKGIADGQQQIIRETYFVLDCNKCILKETEIYPNKENHLKITNIDLQIVGNNDFEGETQPKSTKNASSDYSDDTVLTNKKICNENFSGMSLEDEHKTDNLDKETVYYNELYKKILSMIEKDKNHVGGSKTMLNWKCKLCDRVGTSSTIKTHVEAKHLKEGTYPCNLCGKVCKTLKSLRNHSDLHIKCEPISTISELPSCPKCGKYFVQLQLLKIHSYTHKKEKPTECPHCSKTCSTNNHLTVHIREVHIKEKPHACTHCSMCFSRSTLLRYHIRKNHSGEKLYNCPYCEKSLLMTNSSMKVHMETHLYIR